MLKAFKLRNYKNFKDEISINFEDIAGYQFSTDCISDGILSKMIIYMDGMQQERQIQEMQ